MYSRGCIKCKDYEISKCPLITEQRRKRTLCEWDVKVYLKMSKHCFLKCLILLKFGLLHEKNKKKNKNYTGLLI